MKHDNTHLTLDERKIIQTGIENRSTKAAIAITLAKDETTIAKEIKKHRKLSPRNVALYPSVCKFRKECGGCKHKCDKFEEIKCKFRDRSPGACNKCSNLSKCHLDKYFYYANKADEEYRYDLVDSRQGINMTTSERTELANILVPLINQGQSIYQIKSAHPEIKQSEKCLYNYIDEGVFRNEGLINLSLKEKVKRKDFKNKYKKRKEPSNYDGHKFKDYEKFKLDNPFVKTTEMDTVLNSNSGPYIQTFYFEDTSLMIGKLKYEKTSEAMANSLNDFQLILTPDEFSKLFGLLLTDRGSEFEIIDLFIMNPNTGDIRLNIFYCDSMCSYQKAHVENNHNFIRDIIPNNVDISNITQEDINLMFDHINSTPRESLNGKTPYEMFEFIYGKDLLQKLGVNKIDRDKVILKPYLLKHIYKDKK